MLNEILTPNEVELLHLAWDSIFAPCIVVILISWLLELAFKIARRASIIRDGETYDDEWEQMNIDAYFFCIHKLETFTAWLENYPHSENMYRRICERMNAYESELEYHRSQISPFSNVPVKHSPLGPWYVEDENETMLDFFEPVDKMKLTPDSIQEALLESTENLFGNLYYNIDKMKTVYKLIVGKDPEKLKPSEKEVEAAYEKKQAEKEKEDSEEDSEE